MSFASGALAALGFVLALPGLALIAMADRIDEARTVRELTRKYG